MLTASSCGATQCAAANRACLGMKRINQINSLQHLSPLFTQFTTAHKKPPESIIMTRVLALAQPTAAGEGVDQAAVETARGAVVDILEAGGLAQPGKTQALGERDVVAFDGLAIDQHGQALVEAEAIAVGQALLLLERLGHAGEAQAAQCLDRGVDHGHCLLCGMASIGAAGSVVVGWTPQIALLAQAVPGLGVEERVLPVGLD